MANIDLIKRRVIIAAGLQLEEVFVVLGRAGSYAYSVRNFVIGHEPHLGRDSVLNTYTKKVVDVFRNWRLLKVKPSSLFRRVNWFSSLELTMIDLRRFNVQRFTLPDNIERGTESLPLAPNEISDKLLPSPALSGSRFKPLCWVLKVTHHLGTLSHLPRGLVASLRAVLETTSIPQYRNNRDGFSAKVAYFFHCLIITVDTAKTYKGATI